MTLGSQFSEFHWKGNASGPQQGALFNMKPDNPWVRGYTPSRRAQIEKAMPKVRVEPMSEMGETESERIQFKNDRIDHLRGHEDLEGSRFSGNAEEIARTVRKRNPNMDDGAIERRVFEIQGKIASRNIGDTLSRSKISSPHLNNVSDISIGTSGLGVWGPSENSLGTFYHGDKQIRLARIPNKNQEESVLLHELGHSNDPNVAAHNGIGELVSPSGAHFNAGSEGFANGFSVAHHVLRRPNDPLVTQPYEGIEPEWEVNYNPNSKAHEWAKPKTNQKVIDNEHYVRGFAAGSGGMSPRRTDDTPRQMPEFLQEALFDKRDFPHLFPDA